MTIYKMSPHVLYDTQGWRIILAKHRKANGAK